MSNSQVVCAATTLTSSWATVGSTVTLQGSWIQNASNASLTLRLKHTKHASESGGYPMVRCRWVFNNVAASEINALDPIVDASITVSSGVATVSCDAAEYKILGLTDSDGSLEFPLTLYVPPFAEKLYVQAKQAGDTTNFGTLAVQLTGQI